jgi:hypothetical protein
MYKKNMVYLKNINKLSLDNNMSLGNKNVSLEKQNLSLEKKNISLDNKNVSLCNKNIPNEYTILENYIKRVHDKIFIPNVSKNNKNTINSCDKILDNAIKYKSFIKDLRVLKMFIKLSIMYEKEYMKLDQDSFALLETLIDKYQNLFPSLGDPKSWVYKHFASDLYYIMKKYESAKQSNNKNEEKQIKSEFSHSSTYIKNLEHILSIYEEYILNLSKIDLSNGINTIHDGAYLISSELKNALCLGSKYKNLNGNFFLVLFSIIKNDGKHVLIYNFLEYPDIFKDCLMHYI